MIMKKLSILFLTIFAFEAQAQLPPNYFAAYEFTDGSMVSNSNFLSNTLTGSMTSISDRDGVVNSAADVIGQMNGVNLGATNITNTTLSFWVKNSAIGNSQRIIQIYGTGGKGFRVEMDGTNVHVNATVGSNGVTMVSTSPSPQNIDDNNWHHIAVRTKAINSNNTMEFTLFVDGQPATLSGNSTAEINIGNTITNFLQNATLIIDPLVGQYSGDIDDIYLYKAALTDAEVLQIYNYTVPLPLSRVYVNSNIEGSVENGTSWANAFTSLQQGMDYVLPGGEIWVAGGIYTRSIAERDATFHWEADSVKLYGGFDGTETLLSERDWRENPTILSGDLGVLGNNSDNAFTTLTGPVGSSSNIINYALIDGVMVVMGNANGSPAINRITGGGFYSYDYVRQTDIKNCTFSNNLSSNGAATAIYANFVNKTINFENCIFNDNTSSNIGSAMTVRAKNNKNITTNITNCLFTNNKSTAQLSTNQHSSLFYFGATGTNSTFNINITNSTITKNNNLYTGNEDVGLFLLYKGATAINTSLNLKNNIIWDNGGNNILFKQYPLGVEYTNIIQDNAINDLTSSFADLTNTNVNNVDPNFIDIANGDFTVPSTSPAVDQGSTSGLTLPSVDLNGNSRISGTSIDLGCYEFQSTVGIDESEFSQSLENSIFPNPTTGLVTFSIDKSIDKIEVYTINGQLILTKMNGNSINLEGLNSGVYLIKVETGLETGTLKLIKN